nr:hypothetical protein [Mycobacterium sp.]
MSRGPLPLLMLTVVVVFFTGELWQLSARMSRQRLDLSLHDWRAMSELHAIAAGVRD